MEAVDLAMLPSGKRIVAEMKVDTARDDQRRLAVLCGRGAEREREACHGDAVRVVGVDDVGLQLLDDAVQPPRSGEVHLGFRRERNELEPFGGALAQLAVRMRDERGTLADFAQAVDGQQHLVLPATPGSSGVDVQGEQQVTRPLRRSSASFANLRNT